MEIRHRPRRISSSLPEPSSDDEFSFENEGERDDLEDEEKAENEENEEDLFRWTAQQTSFVITPCSRSEKVVGQAVNCSRPLAIFQLFLTPNMMESFAVYTNEYAFYNGNQNKINEIKNNHEGEDVDEELSSSESELDEDDPMEIDENSGGDHSAKRTKHYKEWKSTTQEELWVFFAMQIMMGIVNLPRTRDYWRKEFRLPLIADLMTRDRFDFLLRYFRVAPLSETETNSHIHLSACTSSPSQAESSPITSPPNKDVTDFQSASNPSSGAASLSESPSSTSDSLSHSRRRNDIPRHVLSPLPHVNSICSILNENFGRYLTPGCQLAYDESMVDFQGFSTIRQYVKGKPHPWGYKLLCLVYKTYVIAFEVYGGKRKESDSPPSELGTTGDAVVRLMERAKVTGFNHIVFLDSWFNSPLLVNKLNDMGIRTCGAVKSQRKHLPKCPMIEYTENGKLKKREDPSSPLSKVQLAKMKPGDFIQYFSGNNTYLLVKDKILMRLLYNHIPGSMTMNRTLSTGGDKSLPLALHHYVNYARGVDVVNQLHYQYIIGRKSKRCWPRLVWWLLELCIINAYYLWKKGNTKGRHMSFRIFLIKEILKTYPPNSPPSVSHPTQQIPHALHELSFSSSKRDCSICSSRKARRKGTRFKCVPCDVYVCASGCYDVHRNA